MKSNPLRLIRIAFVFSVFVSFAQAQIVFKVDGTINADAYGYTNGQSISVTYTLNDYAPTTPTGTLSTGSAHSWNDSNTSDPELWSNVSVNGLIGSWTRPTTLTTSPASKVWISGSLSKINFTAGTDTNGVFDLGLTLPDSTNIRSISVTGIKWAGFSFDLTSGTLPDPTNYFADYTGVYSATAGTGNVYETTGNFSAQFTVNTLTISNLSAVPEPASFSVLIGLSALCFINLRRKRRITQ